MFKKSSVRLMRQSLFASTKTICRVLVSDFLCSNYCASVTLGWSFSPAKTPRGRSLIRRALACGYKQIFFLPQSGCNSRQQLCELVSFILVTIRIHMCHNLKKKGTQVWHAILCRNFFAQVTPCGTGRVSIVQCIFSRGSWHVLHLYVRSNSPHHSAAEHQN